ncbi:MAG: FtsX-like permease family protein [Candidatus Cloacimonetes bacterium]|nr:FtsX-like permease family protein [Candidatus Cloacimonadota bacterium]
MIWRFVIQRKLSLILRQLSRRFDMVFFFLSLLLSVSVLTCTLMLFEGYERALKDSILSFNAHIYFFKPGINDLQELDILHIEDYLKNEADYVSSQAVINGQGMLSIGSNLKGVNYRSIEYERNDLPIAYQEIIVDGSHILENSNDIVIGKQLAESNKVAIGDTLYILAGLNKNKSLSSLHQLPLRVVGTFRTGMYEYDMKNIFVTKEQALLISKKSLGIGNYNLLEVKILTDKLENAKKIAAKWERDLGLRYQVFSWINYNGNIFSLLKLEKWVIGIVLFFLIIIASFSTISSTVTSINEDQKKIAILRSIGLEFRKIYQIYYTKFMLLGAFGIICGLGSGWLLASIISRQGIIKMEGQVYLLDKFHVSIEISTLFVIFFSTMSVLSVSILAALARLKTLNIIDVLRINK